jgi:hypothetical protein
MPEHRFICPNDGTEVIDTTIKGVHNCPKCGEGMAMTAAVTGLRGDYRHTSDSLAIHPDDIPVHRRLFPDIEVTPEGQPQFTSPRRQEAYALESAGCYKKEQRTKSTLGRTRIA